MISLPWHRKRRRHTKPRTLTELHNYAKHKEYARDEIIKRLRHYQESNGFTWNRVSIKNQRHCWGSCSSLRNLNFSYKVAFLPPCLRDYIIVHELCHLHELHHGTAFWQCVSDILPDYRTRIRDLRIIERQWGTSPANLKRFRAQHTCDYCEACCHVLQQMSERDVNTAS